MWERLYRRSCDRVQAPVVIADAPASVRFSSEHHRCGVTRGRVLDPAAIQQIRQLLTKLRQLAVGQAFDRSGSWHRVIAGLQLQLHSPIRRQAGRSPVEHVLELLLEVLKRGVVLSVESEGRVWAEGRQVQLRAVLKDLHPLLEKWSVAAEAASNASPLPCCRLQGRQVRMICLKRLGPPAVTWCCRPLL